MSSKAFGAIPPKFPPENVPESRWTKSKREWDDRIGNARLQAFNWRLIAIILSLCLLVTISGLIYQSSKSTVTPYVIEVDSTSGMARAVGPASASNYTPKEAEVKYFLSQFIQNSRSVPLDPIMYKQNWNKAYMFMRQSAATKMNQYMQNENQISLLGRETVQPNVLVIVPMTNSTYQIRWTEENFSIGGGQKSVTNMTGVFTIEFGQPKDERELLINPLGMYIKDFSYSKENGTR